MASTAHANDKPIEILLDQVKLDLSNPEANAKRTIDKDFKSNSPSVRSRIYKLNDGTRVKLVGKKFDRVSDIDKIKITYPRDQSSYKRTQAALSENFGKPAAKRPDILVWRLNNTTRSSTQRKTIKIIATSRDAEKQTITANRQRGGKGNNPRSNTPIQSSISFNNTRQSQLRPAERD